MCAIEALARPIYDKITSCESQEEVWKKRHEEVKIVYKFETLVGDVLELFDNINGLDKVFRDSIKSDPNSYCELHDIELRALHERFHYLVESVEVTAIAIERDGYGIERIEDLRKCLVYVRKSAKHGYEQEVSEACQSLSSEIATLFFRNAS